MSEREKERGGLNDLGMLDAQKYYYNFRGCEKPQVWLCKQTITH